jgi:hypothetical protein
MLHAGKLPILPILPEGFLQQATHELVALAGDLVRGGNPTAFESNKAPRTAFHLQAG